MTENMLSLRCWADKSPHQNDDASIHSVSLMDVVMEALD